MNILRTLPTKLEHFHLFDHCKTKILSFDLFFNNYVVDRSNFIFFWIGMTIGICNMVMTTLKQLLNFTPVQTILWPHGLLYKKWHCSNMEHWPLVPYQHNKIIKPFVPFQLALFLQVSLRMTTSSLRSSSSSANRTSPSSSSSSSTSTTNHLIISNNGLGCLILSPRPCLISWVTNKPRLLQGIPTG